jgi:flagellar basal-body rod protein FlgC
MSLGSALYPSLTALSAFGTGLQSTAHNLANVLTNGFKAGRVTYADLPRQSGTAARGPEKLAVSGPLVPYGPGLPPPAGGYNPALPAGFVEGSTTDIATEMLNLIITSRAYQANAKVVPTVDSMLGMVINLRV